jgi:hypothetical protein
MVCVFYAICFLLRVLENKALRIFGPMTEEVTGWKKLHKEELHKLYSSQNIRVNKSKRVQ